MLYNVDLGIKSTASMGTKCATHCTNMVHRGALPAVSVWKLGWQTVSKLNIKTDSGFLIGERYRESLFLRFPFLFLP